MEEKIKSGDVVYLKSDIDKEIKINVGHETSIRMFNCYWFMEEGFMTAELPVDILVKY